MPACRYYKQAFQHIPRLAQYDVVVWLDSTLEVVAADAAAVLLATVTSGPPLALWAHPRRKVLKDEVGCGRGRGGTR